MFARVPASSANLGPGFDSLAVALSLYVEVTLDPADQLTVTSEGCGAGLCDDKRHLGVRVAQEVLGHTRFSMHVTSSIPVARGLGSSAALALAAAAAAGATHPLALASRVDGHAENAGASLIGGLVAAAGTGEEAIVRPLPLDEAWRFVVVVPDEELETAAARRVLPRVVPFADAVHNLNALALLVAGLADHRAFVPAAMDDVLHQPYRGELLPIASPLLSVLRESGAAGSCWSGAGSSLLGLVTAEHVDVVERAARTFLHERGVAGEVLVLDADRTGLVTR